MTMGFQARIREANQHGTLSITIPRWFIEKHDLDAEDVRMFELAD